MSSQIRPGGPPFPQDRIVYSARCTWWDSIDKVGKTTGGSGHSLPVCPHCGSPLFEAGTEAQWVASIDKHEVGTENSVPRRDPQPGYRKKMEWARGKCFPNMVVLEVAYSQRDKMP